MMTRKKLSVFLFDCFCMVFGILLEVYLITTKEETVIATSDIHEHVADPITIELGKKRENESAIETVK